MAKKCCETPGCGIKTRRDFEVEYHRQLLQYKLNGYQGKPPQLRTPTGLMAHTEGSEIARVDTIGASLKTRVMDMVEFRIGKKASAEMISLVLNLDDQYRKTASKKMREIALGAPA